MTAERINFEQALSDFFKGYLDHEAIIEALRIAAEQCWRSMDSAPRDGTRILLGYFLEHGGGGGPVVAWWHDRRNLWCDDRGYLNSEGYYSPTHWQPLPSPPGGGT